MDVKHVRHVSEETDDVKKGVVEKYFPRAWTFVKLTRVNQPVHLMLTFWPFAWSLLLSANTNSVTLSQTAFYFVHYLVITVVWVSAGCVINDLWDKNIDAKVERSKSSLPIAAGEISVMEGALFYIALMAVCFLLTIPLNEFCRKLFLFKMFLILIHPISKRILPCPSVAYGVITNWGSLVGWTAVAKDFNYSVCAPLYVGAACWTIMYDTIYGSQDKKDDFNAGAYSMALTLGSHTRTLVILAGAGSICGLILAGVFGGMEWPYYLGMLVASLYLGSLIFTVDLDNPSSCDNTYNSNIIFGFLVFLAILAGSWSLFQRSMTIVPAWHEL